MRRLLLPLLIAACASGGRIELTREVDGAWVHTFDAAPEAAYHAAMRALTDEGWTVVRADPIGRSFSAKSAVERGAVNVFYRIAHVVVEPGFGGGARIRIGLLRTREYAGGGRTPVNDVTITDRDDYEEIFLAIKAALAS